MTSSTMSTSQEANAAKTRTLVAEGFEAGVVLIHDLRNDVRAGRGANLNQ